MAREIKMTEEHMKLAFKDFIEYLKTGSFPDGRISFTKTIGTVERKAKIVFSETAWIKMQTLVREFDKEVAWHGTAYRDEENKDVYHIGDIFVYPQEVSGVTVTTDQSKYQEWLYNLDEDVFRNLRMQGHSHVNMSTSPSTVDTSYNERIVEQMTDDMFYIFLIWNKKNERNIKIYDMRENVMFDSGDVDVVIGGGSSALDEFVKNAKNIVTAKTYSYSTGTAASAQPSKPKGLAVAKNPESGDAKEPHKKKCKRKEALPAAPVNAYGMPYDDYDDDDDFNNPYSAFGYR